MKLPITFVFKRARKVAVRCVGRERAKRAASKKPHGRHDSGRVLETVPFARHLTILALNKEVAC